MLSRLYAWLDARLRIAEPLRAAMDKPVPGHVNWLYCLGGITFAFFLIQVVTGIFLALYYVPTPTHAYASVDYITFEVKFGGLVRGMHHWAANLMVVAVGAHMLRVYLHAAYKPLRELNWVAGVVLLTVTMGFAFTGYLLPWDQKAYWATTVGTSIVGTVPGIGDFLLQVVRGGPALGAVALVRFYWLHVFLLPGIATVFLLVHFAMVRRQGISGPL